MKYFIPPYISIFKTRNLICIGPTNRSEYIEFEDNETNYNEIEKLVAVGLDTTHTEHTESLNVQVLIENGILIEAEQYNIENRNHLFFRYLTRSNLDEKVLFSKILIFGAGAGGGSLCYLLAQFGFNNITVIDNDFVNNSDVLKTVAYEKKHIGQEKVIALKKKIRNNFNIKIKIYSQLPFEESDLENIIGREKPLFVVKACDPDLMFRMNLNRILWKQKIPSFHIAYSYEYLKIGPTYVNGITGCDECMNLKQQEIYGKNYNFKETKRLFAKSLTHPSVSFNINLLANFALKEIVFYLTEQYQYCFSVGQLVYINPLTLSIDSLDIEPNEKCKICNN
jgi:molybdopterin/thiamine biosynthesis adenylyltransferase